MWPCTGSFSDVSDRFELLEQSYMDNSDFYFLIICVTPKLLHRCYQIICALIYKHWYVLFAMIYTLLRWPYTGQILSVKLSDLVKTSPSSTNVFLIFLQQYFEFQPEITDFVLLLLRLKVSGKFGLKYSKPNSSVPFNWAIFVQQGARNRNSASIWPPLDFSRLAWREKSRMSATVLQKLMNSCPMSAPEQILQQKSTVRSFPALSLSPGLDFHFGHL